MVSVDELRRRLAAEARGGAAAGAVAAEALAVKRWGLIPDDADYGALMVDVLTEQIAGYYDRDARKLYIAARATGDDGWADMLLAHEIDHALCDQHFDLRRLFHLPADQGDALAARRALVEGDGVALMVEVLLAERGKAAPWTDPEAALTLEHALEADGPAGGQLGAAPLWVREQLMFPYRAGLAFVAVDPPPPRLGRVDRVYRRPPRSTEQILHPEAYARRRAADPRHRPDPAGPVRLADRLSRRLGRGGLDELPPRPRRRPTWRRRPRPLAGAAIGSRSTPAPTTTRPATPSASR